MPAEQRSKMVAVAGATGRLDLVVDALLAQGHAVWALTRTPDGTSATCLRETGAEVVYGDHEDTASVAVAASGADALFATEPSATRRAPRRPFAAGAVLDETHARTWL